MNVLNKHPPTENAVIIMKIGIKILNERAIPVGTESGILILKASMLVNNPKNFTATIDIIIETNSPCAPITPAPNPLTTTGSFKPSTTVLIVFGHTAK